MAVFARELSKEQKVKHRLRTAQLARPTVANTFVQIFYIQFPKAVILADLCLLAIDSCRKACLLKL